MNTQSNEMKFFVFLLEMYAANKKTTADKVLKRWDKLSVTDKIFRMYERYHCEAIENAFADIDAIIAEKKAADQQNRASKSVKIS